MGLFSGFRSAVGHVIDFRVDRWLNLKWNQETLGYFSNQAKKLCVVQNANHSESFEEAVKRLSLDEEKIAQCQRYYRHLYRFFFLTTMLLMSYATYISQLGNIVGLVMCLAIALYSLTLSFRFHFWHFQISHQRLGCSLKDWFSSIKGVKS